MSRLSQNERDEFVGTHIVWDPGGDCEPSEAQWERFERIIQRREQAARDAALAPLEALADEWERNAGVASDAWRVLGPQSVGVPFALNSVRAAIRDARNPKTPSSVPGVSAPPSRRPRPSSGASATASTEEGPQ